MNASNEPTILWLNPERGLVRLHRQPIGYVRKTLDGKWQAMLLEDYRTATLAARGLVDFCREAVA